MEELISKIEELKKNEISKVILSRMKEFESVEDHFMELCFCLMTANFQAEKCIFLQKEIGEGFRTLSEEELATKLKEMGHRFWPQRAERIVLARELELPKVWDRNSREWLVKNVKGLGLKESSHFLRNIGVKDVAIIDFHIIDLLVEHSLIEKPSSKSITPKRYLEIENVLKKLGERVGLSLAELDLYLWYIETGKVLK